MGVNRPGEPDSGPHEFDCEMEIVDGQILVTMNPTRGYGLKASFSLSIEQADRLGTGLLLAARAARREEGDPPRE